MASEDTVKNLFRKWDTDGNGYISKEELASVLNSLGLDWKQIKELWQAADVNHDNRVDYSEFVSWVLGSGETLPARMVHQRPDRIPRSSLRSEANPSRSVCIPGCSVGNGETVEIFPRHVVNGMVHVKCDDDNSKEGWLKRDYLRAVEDSVHGHLPAKMLHQRSDTITRTSLRSRADPDRSYCIHGQSVQNGEVVDVLPPRQVVNGMVQVLLQNGNKGWLRVMYLQAEGGESTVGGRCLAGGAAIAAAAEAKRHETASTITFDNFHGGGGAFHGGTADGFRFLFGPGEFSDLLKMWAEKKDAKEKRVREGDAVLEPDSNGDNDSSGGDLITDMITELSAYSKEQVLACIQKYHDGKVHERYSGTWYMGVEEKVTRMLEDVQKTVRGVDGEATGFHFEYEMEYYSTDVHIGDAFLIAGHLLWLEFAVFDQ